MVNLIAKTFKRSQNLLGNYDQLIVSRLVAVMFFLPSYIVGVLICAKLTYSVNEQSLFKLSILKNYKAHVRWFYLHRVS